MAPFGTLTGGFRQIYSNNANENIYTEGWTNNFSGFRQMLKTMANTDLPRRVSAANIYYHFYSGEREASLRAVKDSLDAVSQMELAPVTTTRYVEIANGFYTARFEKLSDLSWRVHDRGALATVRFDGAADLNVDFFRSEGVLGARHADDVLYVALDSAHAAPLVALQRGAVQSSNRPVLDNARWEIWDLVQSDDEIRFSAHGFGPGQMLWRTNPSQSWHVQARYNDKLESLDATADAEGLLMFSLPRGAEFPVEITMHSVAGDAS